MILNLLISSCSFAVEKEEMSKYHHVDGGFRNLPGGLPAEKASFFERFYKFYMRIPFQSYDSETMFEKHFIPHDVALKQFQNLQNEPNTITWIGHMTTIIRLDGKVILTDPFFSQHPSPIPPLGPKRIVPPGLKIEDLPPIDLIVISHSHYDHLDLPTLEKIPNKDNVTVVVPLKLGSYVKKEGFSKVIELDWHDKVKVGSLEVIALPVIHNSQRSIFKANDTLWAGFSIISSQKKIFFSGDLEYGTHYKSLSKYGPFDLAILSISPWKPSVKMKGVHCKPIDCLKIGQELHAKNFMPVHWGTVLLGMHQFVEEPLDHFKNGARALGIPPKNLQILKIGETQMIK